MLCLGKELFTNVTCSRDETGINVYFPVLRGRIEFVLQKKLLLSAHLLNRRSNHVQSEQGVKSFHMPFFQILSVYSPSDFES